MRKRRLKSINVIKEMGMNHGTVWEDDFSVWRAEDQMSAIVCIDDAAWEVSHVAEDKRLTAPVSKFNVFKRRDDIY